MKKDQIFVDTKSLDEENDPLGYSQVSIVGQRYVRENKAVVFSTSFQEGQKTRDNDFTVSLKPELKMCRL